MKNRRETPQMIDKDDPALIQENLGLIYSDADYLRDKARIWKVFQKWTANLGLRYWKCTCKWYRENFIPDHDQAIATCDANWKYLIVEASFCCDPIGRMADDELERVVVHELLHALVNEMREDGIEHEERVVSQLTNAIDWTYTAGWNDSKAKYGNRKNSNRKPKKSAGIRQKPKNGGANRSRVRKAGISHNPVNRGIKATRVNRRTKRRNHK